MCGKYCSRDQIDPVSIDRAHDKKVTQVQDRIRKRSQKYGPVCLYLWSTTKELNVL